MRICKVQLAMSCLGPVKADLPPCLSCPAMLDGNEATVFGISSTALQGIAILYALIFSRLLA